jgi:hypothetical protein
LERFPFRDFTRHSLQSRLSVQCVLASIICSQPGTTRFLTTVLSWCLRALQSLFSDAGRSVSASDPPPWPWSGLRGLPGAARPAPKGTRHPLLGFAPPSEYVRLPHTRTRLTPLDGAGQKARYLSWGLFPYSTIQAGRAICAEAATPRLRAVPRVSHPLNDRLPSSPSRPLFQAGALMGLTASTH